MIDSYNNNITMQYQKIINLLDDTMNQPSKFRTKILVKISGESKEKNNNGSIRCKTSMTRSNFCDYSDAYILAKGTIRVLNTADIGVAVNNTNKKVGFKSCAPLTDCMTKKIMHKCMMFNDWYGNAYVYFNKIH